MSCTRTLSLSSSLAPRVHNGKHARDEDMLFYVFMDMRECGGNLLKDVLF